MPNALARIGGFSQAMGLRRRWSRMQFPGFAGTQGTQGSVRFLLPNTRRDWEHETGDTWKNSVVATALRWVSDNALEPELLVERVRGKGKDNEIPDHPMTALIRKPNDDEDDEVLWGATCLSYVCDGNAYWLKVRGMGGAGRPVALWYVPHYQMFPRWPSDGSEFISHYQFWLPTTGRLFDVRKEDVVHFRWGKDPRNERYGMSPLKAMFRSIVSDNFADNYTASLLANSGVASLLISAKNTGESLDPTAIEGIRRQWSQDLQGDGVGGMAALDGDVEVHRGGFTPEEMALDKIRQVPESRILGAIGVNAMVLGINVGDNQRTYNNMGEAIRLAYDSCLKPLQRRWGKTLDRHLLPDFVSDPQRYRCCWDYAGVQALQENRDERSKRVVQEYAADVVTLDEAREELGYVPLGPEKGGDQLRREVAQEQAIELGKITGQMVTGDGSGNKNPKPKPQGADQQQTAAAIEADAA